MEITYYGHSTFSLETQGKILLFDPFITDNPHAQNSNIAIESLRADYILLSHAHNDHSADLVSAAKNTGATVIAAWEAAVWCNNHGVQNTHPMNTGGSRLFDFGMVKCTNAAHSSSFGDGSYGGNPMGFIISNSEGVLYYSGDTALTMDMKIYGETHNIDWAVLPIGDNFTMGPDDAAIAAEWLNCSNIIGVHYDTFGYIVIDKDNAKKIFSEKGKTLHLLPIGISVNLDSLNE